MDYTGKIIEYTDGDSTKLAFITKVQGKKLQILDENGRQGKLGEKQVLIKHTHSCDASQFRQEASELKAKIGKLCEDVDLELLWEETSDNPTALSLSELGDLYYGSATPLQLSALCRKLMADELRFRFKNQLFTPRSSDEIERERKAKIRKQEREEREKQVKNFVRRALNTDQLLPVPQHLEGFVQGLEAFLLQGHHNEAHEILKALNYEQSPEELAFDILVRSGQVSMGSDCILKIAGLNREFDERVAQHASTASEHSDWEGREDFTEALSFSIDDDDTTEIDDAITVETIDGKLRVGVHIADLSCFVQQEDPVDEEALRRCATIYMPTGPVHMIPEPISCQVASLNQGELRPCFTTLIEFGTDGRIADWRICRGRIAVQHRLNYEEADQLISEGKGELADALRELDKHCSEMTKGRLDAGAMIFSKNELKVRVNDGNVVLKTIQTYTPSRNIISELMIQTNRLTAEFARRNKIPIIYRAQVPPDDPAHRYMGQVVQDTNPNVFRGLKKSRLSLQPQPHAGLGLKAYTQVTSPLRRFGDLVMQRQIAAFLHGRDYPYTSAGLLEVIGNAEVVERENRTLERRSTRFWELEYLRRDGIDKVFQGTVMSKLPGAYMVALSPYPVRGRMVARDHLKFGQKIQVRITALNPPLSIIRLEQA